MAEQERKRIRRESPDQEEIEEIPAGPGGELAEKIDELLDEIDSVLEENAEEFVNNYVQKGGE
jgi:ubiquitin-like protein Pup